MVNDEPERELREMMDRYGTMVSGISRARLVCPHDADDVFQEVFLLYYTKELYFESETARRSWFIRATINLCRNENRSRKKTGSIEDEEKIADEQPLKTAEENEVWNAVKELKQRYFLPVYLYYFENMPIALISKTLNIKEGAVQMRLVRARREIKQKLERKEKAQ